MSPGPDPDPDGERDDVALLEAHVAGDPAAFGELFARHRDRLWAVALRTTGNPEDAADALQDALISAFKRAESFRGDSAVTTWLHRIVVNACLDRLRRAKVRLADPLPDDLEERATLDAVAGAEPAGDPEAHALAGDRRQRVLAALDELHADQKAALVLVDMEGYPVQEAARILEVPRARSRAGAPAAGPGSRCCWPIWTPVPRTEPRTAPLRRTQETGPGAPGPPADPPGPTERPDARDQTHQHADPREEVSGHE